MDQVTAAHLRPWITGQPGQRCEAPILARPGVSNAERHAGPCLADFGLSEPQVAAQLEVFTTQLEFVHGVTLAPLPTKLAKCATEEPPNLGFGQRRRPAHYPRPLT